MRIEEAEQKRLSIRSFMDTYGLTAAQWSKLADMSPNTLYSFINGKCNDITYGTLLRLARAVGVTVGTIMGEASYSRPILPKEAEILEKIRTLSPSQQKMLSTMIKGISPEHPASSKKRRGKQTGDCG